MNQDLIKTRSGNSLMATNFRAKQKCTPSVVGCSLCIGGEVRNGSLFVILTVNTPLGSNDFEFEAGSGFVEEFTIADLVTVHISVSNIQETGAGFSFLAKAKLCGDVPIIGRTCTPEVSHTVNVPFAGIGALSENTNWDELPYLMYSEYQNEQCGCH